MKRAHLLLCLLALIFTASPAWASYIDLGIAGDFNTFIFNNYSNTSDTGGRLAVGGDAFLTGYSVGQSLPAGSSGSALVVGGNLAFTNGEVHNGDVTVGGAATLVSVTVPDGTVSTNATLPFVFADVADYLTALSLSLSGNAANGLVVDNYGSLTLHGDNSSGLQVFNISGGELLNANGLSIDQIADTATILINVSGATAGLTNMGMAQLAAYSDRILFNFYEAENLILSGIGVEGSILAPLADIHNAQGVISGTLIASSFDGTMEQEYNPFDSGTPVPEPGTCIILGLGLSALAVFLRRRLQRVRA